MSEIKDIIPLKQVAGSKNTGSTTYNWLFKVTTYSDYAGPLQVLSAFPIGKTLEAMVYSTTDVPSKDGFPICYQWPGFDRCNYDTGWDSGGLEQEVRSIDNNAVITNVSILDRTFEDQDQDFSDTDFEPYSKENRAWYVNVTFTSIDDSGIYETPVINETYQDRVSPAHWGEFKGVYERTKLSGGEINDATKWLDVTGDGVSPLFYSETAGSGGNNRNLEPHCIISNSAGIPYDPPITKRSIDKVITMTWVSPFALDFSESIGKVNCNKVALSAPCGNPERINGFPSISTGDTSEIPGSVENKQYTVYSEKFLPRTLLLNNVGCELFTVFGRDFFRYTATLIYDRYEHDVFLLDEGYEQIHGEGYDVVDGNETYGLNASGPNVSSRVPNKDAQGMTSNHPSLLDGNGRVLLEVNPEVVGIPDGKGATKGRSDRAVWLRWRVRDEVLFTLPRDYTAVNDYSTIDQIQALECPLMLGTKSFWYILESDMNPLETYCQSLDTGPTG